MKRYLLTFLFCFALPLYASPTQLIIEPDQGVSPILHIMAQGKTSVDLVMYGLTDKTLLQALIRANTKNKKVRVLLQEHPYKAEDENEAAIQQLEAAHVPLHWPDNKFTLTHQKTLLIDHQTAMVSTFNFTHATFTHERNFAIVVKDPRMVKEIQQVFDADWQHKNIVPNNPNLLWSPDNTRARLIDVIHHAQREIKLYVESLSDYQLVGALAKAARAGVKIYILTSDSADGRGNKKFDYLRKAGVVIHFSHGYVIHAKVMMVDQGIAVIGSTNMTAASIDNNRELSVITHDTTIIKQLTHTFDQDWVKM